MADAARPAVVPRRRRTAALAVPLLAGAVAGLGQAPFGWWPLALAGFAIGALPPREARLRAAALRGWRFGVGYFAVTLHWIVEPFLVDLARHGWMAPFALVAVVVLLALFYGAAAGAASAVARSPARYALAWPVAMGVSEAVRGHWITGFPWVLPAYIWADTPVAQTARLVGPYGLSLATLLVAALGAWAWTMRRPGPGAAAVAAAVALWAAGWLLQTPAPGPAADAPVVRLVQPNVPQHEKWDSQKVDAHFRGALAATSAAAANRPDLVVWPESAIVWPLAEAGAALRMIAEAGAGAPVVLGLNRFEGQRVFNSLAVVGPDGIVAELYDKFHLVPFGEFVPLGHLAARLGIRGLAARDGFGFSAGPGPRVLTIPGLGRVRPLICYEAIFPAHAAGPERVDWLLQITNDAWFGTFAGPQQHLAQARFRAIEQGLPLVRAANTGISTVTDARGQILQTIPLGVAAWRDVALPPPAAPTLYSRTGDRPVWLALSALALVLVLLRLRKAD